MIEWYWAMLGGLYAAGAAGVFVIHQLFDGGLVYPTKRDGPMRGLLLALCWPLWAALLTVVIPIEWVRSLRK